VPVTIYVELEEGLALTEVPVVADNPVDGLQAYVLPPLAVSATDCPLQSVVETGRTPMEGNGFYGG